MKKNYFFTAVFLLQFLVSFGQKQNPIGCGTQLSQKEEAAFVKSLSKIKTWKKSNTKRSATTPYIIPVVFHILADGTNINNVFTKEQMKCRIDDALLTINKDFNGLFPEYAMTDPRFDAVKSKMNIQFVLATVDPDGNPLELAGLDWHPEAHVVDGYDAKIYDYIWYGKNNRYYLDVLVVDEPNTGQGSVGSGHAFLPIQDAIPRVAYNHRYIGSTCGSNASTTFAKVMTHEFGHYFGLKHTFQDDCDPVNDGMADTPPTKVAEGCARKVLNSCGVYPNAENHMDYNTDCQNMYTRDQTNAMTYWLDDMSVAKYPRGVLWQQSNLSSVGVIETAPVANFNSNTTAICSGKTISFKDISLGLPTSRVWTFEGGIPATSTDLNPVVAYNASGKYKVTLEVTNSLGTNTKQVFNYIEVDQKSTANLVESFTGAFPPLGWEITNPDNGLTWEKRKNVGHNDSSCMIMNNADNAVVGSLDYIRLPYLDFTAGQNSQLFFDVAYTKFDDASPDVLKVQVSTDCGLTWNDVYSKTHIVLQTTEVPTALANNWVPVTDANWRKEVVDLSAYQGNSNVSIRFANVSGYGTRIWIDNVNVAITQAITPISDFTSAVRGTRCSTITVPFLDVSTGNPTSWAWSFPGGTPATSTEKNPIVVYNSPGHFAATLTTTNANGTGTTLSKNNFITVTDPDKVSYTEGFENSFPPAEWEIINPDNKLTWEKRIGVGHNSSSCMVMNNADNDKVGAIDEIILKPVDLSVGITDFSFDVAYAKFDASSPDVLEILASKDCGLTWQSVCLKTHTELETFVSTDPNNWVPTSDSQWRTERIILLDFKGSSNVLFKFKNTSGYGSRIWIDNLKFTFDSKEPPFSEFVIKSDRLCSDLPIGFNDSSTGEPTSWAWSFPGGTPATSTSKTPNVIYDSPGTYNVTLTASNSYGTGSVMQKTGVVVIKAKNSIPFLENFEGSFPVQDWEIINPDKDAITWEKRSDAGKGDLSCMIINNADNPTGLVDELILKAMDFSTSATPYLYFDLAYTQYLNAFDPTPAPDHIDITVSSDCGVTWTNVYSKNQIQLQTVSPAIQDDPATTGANETNDWIPTKDSDWRAEKVDLSMVKNQKNVLIKIKNTSGYGTRIWFDNLKIDNGSNLAVAKPKKPNSLTGVQVYPNPSSNVFNFMIPTSTDDYTVTVHNVEGKMIYTETFSGENNADKSINLAGKAKGVYFLNITSSSKKTYNQKIIKK
ncbi:putative secreted protein (Por secretion system target) [Flavobacterium sp. 9]|uniref:PKD domain-containing protein n=1 Tax=Flavobacterium sp. 9 TaxID=2035198 RepID=UPI000C1869CC|nr:PKD domain-containing protein [Flavobacterium sp. 9]PIF30513.1 putative secreted protein (Por secretion system target) [Flavobacterium sp. 9]